MTNRYAVTWYDNRTNSYETETFTSGKDWGNKVLIVNGSDDLRLVATEAPDDDL
jgi:hypothetical protein